MLEFNLSGSWRMVTETPWRNIHAGFEAKKPEKPMNRASSLAFLRNQ
jgi:hypothetical protein